MTIGQLRAVVSAYYANATLAPNGVDLILDALNQAQLEAQQRLDFELGYQYITGIVAAGNPAMAQLSAFTNLDATPLIGMVNALRNAWVLVNGYKCPIELVSKDVYETRQRRLNEHWILPRYPSDSDFPSYWRENCVYRVGQTVYMHPWRNEDTQLVFDASVWLAPYTQDGQVDFLTTYCANYLKWSAIAELNPVFKEFVTRQEGNIAESTIQAKVDRAWDAVERWNAGIDSQNPVTR